MSLFGGFQDDSADKQSACNAGDPGSISGLERSPGEWNDSPLKFLPGESHGQRSLVGYEVPWGSQRVRHD